MISRAPKGENAGKMPGLRVLKLGFLLLRRSGGLGLLRQLRERRGVLHRHVGQHLAVQRNARGLQPVNQLTVSHAVLPRGRADTLNPQAAILALLYAAIALRIAVRAVRRFLRRLVKLALREEKAFRPLEVLLAPCTALGAWFYAFHGGFSFNVRDKQDAPTREKTGVAQRVCLRLGICGNPMQAVIRPSNRFRRSEDGGRNPPPHAANLAVRSSPAGRHP